MEKLLNLLNEYKEYERPKFTRYIDDLCMFTNGYRYETYLMIISKEYGFIHWLVDNDKIFFGKIKDKFCKDKDLFYQNRKKYGKYERLLMILAIQDDPIEFLVYILK